MSDSAKPRCWPTNEAIYIQYHDEEWGVPQFDSQKLFEMLVLEGMQAGLSWITVLKKRADYQRLFYEFDASKIVRYCPRRRDALLQDSRIIRNRLKVEAIINNARCYLELQRQSICFSEYIWSFVDGTPIKNHWSTMKDVPAKTDISDTMSRDLKKKGFKFVGSTICYAFMQAAGLVDDHIQTCWKNHSLG